MEIPSISSELTEKHTKLPLLGYRLIAIGITVSGLALLFLARSVEPDPQGFGSHQQLGLPECGFHQRTGYPCPTCGMTTAFAYMVRGRPIQAFITQPAGALTALACLGLTVMAGYAALTGKKIRVAVPRGLGLKITLIVLITVLLSWLWRCAIVWRHNSL
jgi:hypothetical protein